MCATREDLEAVNDLKKMNDLEGFEELSDAQKTAITRSLRHKKPYEPVKEVTGQLTALTVAG